MQQRKKMFLHPHSFLGKCNTNFQLPKAEVLSLVSFKGNDLPLLEMNIHEHSEVNFQVFPKFFHKLNDHSSFQISDSTEHQTQMRKCQNVRLKNCRRLTFKILQTNIYKSFRKLGSHWSLYSKFSPGLLIRNSYLPHAELFRFWSKRTL